MIGRPNRDKLEQGPQAVTVNSSVLEYCLEKRRIVFPFHPRLTADNMGRKCRWDSRT